MSNTRRSGEFIVPGERIGVIEEFIPNFGTYVQDGVIYSRNVGYVSFDSATRKVSVYTVAKGLSFPKIGSIVVGHVVNIQGLTAFMRIVKIGKKHLSGFLTGALHVSDIDTKYTKEVLSAVKVGDLVRAKVISDANRILHLTTKGENLGVILALCSKCGGTLLLKNRKSKKLYCGKCGNFETRKIASDYGAGNM
ncbi:MAG: exosome complex RNA-binding protein Csl4 [Candidatus Brockarchaeota archaeon]|nr:exosome complex RNA-binding protein Csl4 [Candidatus Brockarchaeota archaeon]MBS7633901.1 exosome complex RNA-binding protein Csl4 [Candidatus Bathyarchaeota archaeon]